VSATPDPSDAPLGLIAGDGRLPAEIAAGARRAGRRVVAVAFDGITDPDLSDHVDAIFPLALGQLDAMLSVLAEAGVCEAVLAGKVSKQHWLVPGGAVPIRPDARALSILAGLDDRGDDALLGAVAACLEDAGVRLLPQARWIPEMVPGPGPLGRRAPGPDLWRDVACGWRAAKGIAGLDLGQTAVAREGAVLALEAVEGTDEAIRRGGRLGGPGATVVKVAKPGQDPRFDMPTIGTGTLEAAVEAGLVCIAFEAAATLVLGPESLADRADREGIVILGVPSTGPPSGESGCVPDVAGGAREAGDAEETG
jgi:DUF1009 family protein